MAYALLANCPPVFGIYASIFPVIVYAFIGPSPFASKGKIKISPTFVLAVLIGVRKLYDMKILAGTNALMCMLTGSLVLHYKSKSESSNDITGDNDEAIVPAIVASLCLLAGAWQVLLAALQFPRLSWLLSGM